MSAWLPACFKQARIQAGSGRKSGTSVCRQRLRGSGRPESFVCQPSPTLQVMKLDLLAGKPAQEVADIWLEYHSQQGGPGRVGAVLSAADWELLQERGKKR